MNSQRDLRATKGTAHQRQNIRIIVTYDGGSLIQAETWTTRHHGGENEFPGLPREGAVCPEKLSRGWVTHQDIRVNPPQNGFRKRKSAQSETRTSVCWSYPMEIKVTSKGARLFVIILIF